MQLLQIDDSTTLQDLTATVGSKIIDGVLQLNSLPWSSDVGKNYKKLVTSAAAGTAAVSIAQKVNILNTLTKDSDIFEAAAMLGEEAWKVLKSLGTLPGYLKMPDTANIPSSAYTMGDNQPVKTVIYNKAIASLKAKGTIDPVIFNDYDSNKFAPVSGDTATSSPYQAFNLPWGKISLYSSLADKSVYFPVYPEELDDETIANYEQMPDTIFQYEPWQTYKSSGPRSITLTFKMHRDMWSGDHRDGKCQELVRFCQAQCYPRYRGAAVFTPIVSMYIEGQQYIRGIVTSVKPHWEGPIGLDGWYLVCNLDISITEVAQVPLNYDSVMKGGLIGWDT